MKEVTPEFCRALRAYIEELAGQGSLSQKFGYSNYDYNLEYWDYGVYKERVSRKMLQELGYDLYPLPTYALSSEQVFEVIEFFFKFVSKPSGSSYDGPGGRHDYTVAINKLFDNFRLAYKLEKGLVRDVHSSLLDKVVVTDDFTVPDQETQALLDVAKEKFYSRKPEEQRIALEKMVDVLQRVSSWEDENKPRSIEKILCKVCGDDGLAKELLKDDLKVLWSVANDFMIRHTEMNKPKITDMDFVEYLFYTYYSYLRLILKKYDAPKKVTSEPQDDDIPVAPL
jgi:hypothetical protein